LKSILEILICATFICCLSGCHEKNEEINNVKTLENNLEELRTKYRAEYFQKLNKMSIADNSAQNEIDLIVAKIRAIGSQEESNSNKLTYCKTNPEWRAHGVLVAKELARIHASKTEFRNYKQEYSRDILMNRTNYLRPVEILDCFNSASLEDVETFFLPEKKQKEELMRTLENNVKTLVE
jgi:hypothetical protein